MFEKQTMVKDSVSLEQSSLSGTKHGMDVMVVDEVLAKVEGKWRLSKTADMAPSNANKRVFKRPKVESTKETKASTAERLLRNTITVKEDACTHPGSFGGMCICCGQKLDGEYGVTFGYIHKGLRLHNEEISRWRSDDMKNLLRQKKLYLVLDLDHTLLNSTQLVDLNLEEAYLLNQANSLTDVSKGDLFKLDYMHTMTKLRPFVHTFLNGASTLFEMYIFTMGDRSYALEMAKLLDPKGEYFHSKVISRDDGTQKHQKGLDIVLGQESTVLILDDTENELDNDLGDRDVRQVLMALKSEVLKGSVLVFSRIAHAMLPSLRKMAEQMGATCLSEVDPSVTHVVATDMGTAKASWAMRENKFLVHPRWIEAANFFWQKQPEENFCVTRKR
ncbi:RNA polymerase II C-terminal domain phosphatase-like 4 isoform X2 [Prosopis cineraria]|uniref:RNA polymerase II C-terminal domain phosphatase-like 4 isoform X2 n=1 Tax=Prosopis cineraria TaxID=364024 RepID=UPI00240F9C9E|nr:RNA polymerase II C-terminal domain phosphatase-like 4 isoform X2 [Prosopis cineraria]